MKPPPFLIGAVLIFWGWQTHLWYAAIPMFIILEGARLVKTRWDLTLADFIRISDLSTIVLIGIVVYTIFADAGKALMVIIQWLPVVLFPMVAAQHYSTASRVDIRALLLLARKEKGAPGKRYRSIDLSYPYIVFGLVSAAGANVRNGSFYIGLIFLASWALWPMRSKRFSAPLWTVLLISLGVVGYAGHMGLYRLQNAITDLASEYFLNDADPYRAMTSIGDIGELKLSNRILFRVAPNASPSKTLLLREASYNSYRSASWYAFRSGFTSLTPFENGMTWKLGAGSKKGDVITVAAPLKRGRGMLKLPGGAFLIENLPAEQVAMNPLGAVRVEAAKGLLTYRISYDPNQSMDSLPSKIDLQIPEKELPAISRIIKELELASKSSQTILTTVNAFFQSQYQYTLDLDHTGPHPTPLANFLLETRKGHCEYFATATVLILRACGIPARYAAGYAVKEYSPLEKLFVVRSRHAHAWTLAYIDGSWQNWDTTSATWAAVEAANASKLNIISDLGSFMLFKLSKWRWSKEKGELKKYALWLLVPLAIILARRLHVRKKIKRITTTRRPVSKFDFSQGLDSDFYLLEKQLNELGYQRHPWETFPKWIARIGDTSPLLKANQLLAVALNLHYQNRFGSKVLSAEEKTLLGDTITSLLVSLRR